MTFFSNFENSKENHSDFIEYTPIKKEIKAAEEAEKKTVRFENIVVLQQLKKEIMFLLQKKQLMK